MGILKKALAGNGSSGVSAFSAPSAPYSPRPTAAAGPAPVAPLPPPTDEMREIIETEANLVLVNAGAGTGKTTTLQHYTRARPKLNFLYLAFSKALQLEASRKFRASGNTTCMTSHGLAMRRFGGAYANARKLGNIKPLLVANRFGVDYRDAAYVVETIKSYLLSVDQDMTEAHLPADVRLGVVRSRVMDCARKTWAAMQDLKDPMPMEHNGYLKQYVLSNPDLSAEYDVILFDEAQDANPITTQLVLSQRNTKVLMVGDRYQSIFGFNGAENAMEDLQGQADSVFNLTQSFRFGEGVASLATDLLHDFRGSQMKLVGRGKHQKTQFWVDESQQHTVLCRTNGGLFQKAIEAVQAGTPFNLVTGFENYQFEKILDVYRLYTEQRGEIKDPMLRRFQSYGQAHGYAKETEDKELQSMLRIVDEHRTDVPGFVEEIRNGAITDAQSDRAVLRLTTAHRSKGLEFEQVKLNDDFSELIEDGSPIAPESREDREEIHLAYVAATRAERAIDVGPALHDWMVWKHANDPAAKWVGEAFSSQNDGTAPDNKSAAQSALAMGM